jgi:hypothetical protein
MLPACAINLAPTNSPTIVVRFGAIAYILFLRYSESYALYSVKSRTYWDSEIIYDSS